MPITETTTTAEIYKKVVNPGSETYVEVPLLDEESQRRIAEAHNEMVGKYVDIGNGDREKVEAYSGPAKLTKKVITNASVEWKPVA